MKPLRPYLYRAYYDWLLDNNLTPYLLVDATYPFVNVPVEYVKEGQIVLNLHPESIGYYRCEADSVQFSARFNGVVREIYLPFGSLISLYGRENGEGFTFPEEPCYAPELATAAEEERAPAPKKRPSHLKLVK